MLAGLATLGVLGAFYLLCAGSTSLDEDVAAAVVALVGAMYAGLIRSVAVRRFALAAPWQRVVGRPLAQLLPDAWRVGGVLTGTLTGAVPRGAVIRQPFRYGPDDPVDAGGGRWRHWRSLSRPMGIPWTCRTGGGAAAASSRPAPASFDVEWPL